MDARTSPGRWQRGSRRRVASATTNHCTRSASCMLYVARIARQDLTDVGESRAADNADRGGHRPLRGLQWMGATSRLEPVRAPPYPPCEPLRNKGRYWRGVLGGP